MLGSRLGFLLLSAGCAIGLGNVWRFPYITGAYGGAIFVNGGGTTVNMSGGTISGNHAEVTGTGNNAKAYGGAIYIQKDSIVNLSGGTIEGNYAVGTNGSFGGGISFDKTVSDAQNGRLNIQGSPLFGSGNFVATDYSATNLKNGGEAYPEFTIGEDTKARPRQDIYIPAVSDDASCITVTGNISPSVPAGSIWVWAQTDNTEAKQHYRNTQQFAVLGTGVSAETVTGLTAFRDAQDDITTSGELRNTGDYLTGVLHDGDTANVYWGVAESGSRLVILKKTYGSGAELPGAKFQIFKGGATSPMAVTDASGSVVTDEGGDPVTVFTSTANGVIYEGSLPIATYYIHELSVPEGASVQLPTGGLWFTVTVTADGVTVSEPRTAR